MKHRPYYYYLKMIRRHQRFVFNGKSYKYFVCRTNYSFISERIVEVPIFWDIIQEYRGKDILEVGNVLSYYHNFQHDVVDKYEHSFGVTNEDIVTYAPGRLYDCIVSISTLEHVGFDESPKDPGKVCSAVTAIKKLLKPGGLLAVSIPVGYNRHLDIRFHDGSLGMDEVHCLKRTSRLNKWKEVSSEEVKNKAFNKPYPYANAILVGFWKNR